MTDPLQAVAGRRGWIISDGKAGHEAQARGVAKALGLAVEFKRVAPAAPWSVLSPWGPVARSERFGGPSSPFRPPWPDFAFAIGRLTIPYIRRLKQMAGLATYTVILLDPKVSARTADLFWVPEHDRLRGPNVITTLTAPHTFTARRLAELRSQVPAEIAALPSPRVAVLLGGPNGDYRYTPPRVAHLASALQSLGALGAGLMITPSRRTPPDVGRPVARADGRPAALLLERRKRKPVCAIPGSGRCLHRAGRFHQHDGGAVRDGQAHLRVRAGGWLGKVCPLSRRPAPHWAPPGRCRCGSSSLDSWTYPPLELSASAIAAEIARRWVKRRQMLGGR